MNGHSEDEKWIDRGEKKKRRSVEGRQQFTRIGEKTPTTADAPPRMERFAICVYEFWHQLKRESPGNREIRTEQMPSVGAVCFSPHKMRVATTDART